MRIGNLQRQVCGADRGKDSFVEEARDVVWRAGLKRLAWYGR